METSFFSEGMVFFVFLGMLYLKYRDFMTWAETIKLETYKRPGFLPFLVKQGYLKFFQDSPWSVSKFNFVYIDVHRSIPGKPKYFLHIGDPSRLFSWFLFYGFIDIEEFHLIYNSKNYENMDKKKYFAFFCSKIKSNKKFEIEKKKDFIHIKSRNSNQIIDEILDEILEEILNEINEEILINDLNENFFFFKILKKNYKIFYKILKYFKYLKYLKYFENILIFFNFLIFFFILVLIFYFSFNFFLVEHFYSLFVNYIFL